ncbi:hypothetical protein [Pseudoalteromonas obscura]|uniref:DUF2306 domain-containing protein n=1 Tax=Pseudoalteromonas obscura TaxID=3048491 RepID=A0ABT7ELE9_9GAMM|nr:hypothetical protein [Pseudoalteromonas sp. P94(2023)]MDK2595879.1 hypothetical protein [Pseudoalteromonas sp. P94(2023)]
MSLTVGMVGHMVFGGAGLIAGFSAFIAKKGSLNHIFIGRIYVIAMILMAVTGFYYAYIRAVHISMFAAVLTAYLVATSWLYVQKKFKYLIVTRYLPIFLGFPVFVYASYLSYLAMNGITDDFGHFQIPAIKYYEFALATLIAFGYDLLFGLGKAQNNKQRISQHIWRMAFTLYIACSAFFEGQAKLFPESLQYSVWLSLPEKFVLGLMVYWLFKGKIQKLWNKF